MSKRARLFSVPLLCLASQSALAEGSDALSGQIVQRDTLVYVDVFDSVAESIRWVGAGAVDVTDPDGASLGLFDSGATIAPTVEGAYQIAFQEDQDGAWSLDVLGATDAGGRVYSYDWHLDGDGYRESDSFSGSFYVLVDAGDAHAIVELRAEGLSGYDWDVIANGAGVDGPDAGRSVDCADPACADQSWGGEFPVYLSPPSASDWGLVTPGVGPLTFDAGELPECEQIALTETSGTFHFDSDVPGTYHLVCDLNGDGVFDVTSADDLALNGPADAGANAVEWNGMDNSGSFADPGTYDCQVTVTIGEVHYLGVDMETAYPGLQFFQVTEGDGREPLPAFWNDQHVQAQAIEMPSGEPGLGSSGADGIAAGAYAAPIEANTNARSWGDFENDGKGDANLLDTFTWIDAASSGAVTVELVQLSEDADGDGIPDYYEDCVHGTDADSADSDGDGASDNDEILAGYDPLDPDDAPEVEETPEEVIQGYIKGGACAATPVGAGWWLALIAAGLVARRRGGRS